MANEMAGRVAIVTGGTMGIGAATAQLLVEEGAKVVIAGRGVEAGERALERLGANGRFRQADIGRRADIEDLVEFTLAQFGRVDVMVNNAAITGRFHNRFLEDELTDFDEIVQIDLAGVMHGSQIAARHMVKQGGGSIINITSIAAMVPGYSLMTYRAAKAGVINFTRSLAIDLGEYCVRVNAIAPGHIPTRINDFGAPGLKPEQQAELVGVIDNIYTSDQPLKRKGSARDLANAVLFFSSDRSCYVTGQVLAVDGGVTAGSAINMRKMLVEARSSFLDSLTVQGSMRQ